MSGLVGNSRRHVLSCRGSCICDFAGYYCPNWKASGVAVKTNKPVNPPCRGPGNYLSINYFCNFLKGRI